jgi:flagellar basal-body rod modification protein FlgD
VGGSSSTDNTAAINAAFAALGPNDFLKMMLAQLQNQSPLDPTNSNDMLQELSTLTQVSTSQSLQTTLNSVLLGQNLADAGVLIGATVSGLSDDAQRIVGTVSSVSISSGTPKLNIGSATMSLSNIESIYPPGSTVNTGTNNGTSDGTSSGTDNNGTTSGTSST